MTYEPGWALVNDFVAAESVGRAATTARRYERIRLHLTGFLDTADLSPVLPEDAVTLLEAERQFTDQGAFWALYGPEELLLSLPLFLREPWLMMGVADARTQASLVGRMARYLARYGWVDARRFVREMGDVRRAVEGARHVIRARSEQRASDEWARRIPARFRGGSGWQW